MILIADSGSTKTIWKCTDGAGKVFSAQTEGINPYYNKPEEITRAIRNAGKQFSTVTVDHIFFYGAGCSTDQQKEIVRHGLYDQFGAQFISVNSDLLGAARSVFQHDPGIVCILGTGSGSCVYDGAHISRSIPSLGFILGDEGSGAYLGKLFVRDFLREDMPADLLKEAQLELGISKEDVLRHVNREPMPSRYLASFSRFIHERLDHSYIHDLVSSGFRDFIEEYLVRYEDCQRYNIGFIGSIAVQYQKILKEVLDRYDITLKKIESNPIDGLIEFHFSDTN